MFLRYRPELVDIAERVKLISSKYFHCLAVTESQKIFQWGTSPQTLKMKIFLAKRVRAANKEQQQQPSSSPSSSTTPADKSSEQLEMSQTHLSVVQVEHMVRCINCLLMIVSVSRRVQNLPRF